MGRIVHFEIPSENPEKSLDFYSKTFGWKAQKWGEMDYWLFETGETKNPGINGALIKKQQHFTTVINTINIDNIEQTMESISKNGGEVISPVMDLPEVGKIAYFKDPDGNVFAVIEDAK